MSAMTQQNFSGADFSLIYRSHELMVRKIVTRFKFCDAAADDLVQNIFIKAWSNLGQLDNHTCLAGWLKVIARNHCLNEVKAQKLVLQRLAPVETFPEIADEPLCDETFALPLLELEQHLAALHHLIEHHKNPIRRQIACLFYLEKRSIKEIGEDMQMNQNTILSHLRRFRLVVSSAMQRWMQEQAHG
ncbi:MAG TPA: sigma-70 family RNA polymerase sigma factor [Oligoflexus sp.]|uniref:RNA polymerase sigma factor n=1 Tax=Oligoflexus sp. TaxID=1971216 RepID=UPI002D512B81|nr:sigma-70 family RNA polymerase sigma factor [Oligoflexus sp.]HYX34592.1 sigma-70 family RNA polymerase sigma factor [Oligoflexus sp.]